MNIINNYQTAKKEKLRDDWVMAEAERCLGCFDPPCQNACPASIPIPEFIRSIVSGNHRNAAGLVRQANPMVATCGEVCPEEVFCQSACTRNKIDKPIKIRELHSFATKHEILPQFKHSTSKSKIAIIGAGPAGISCAVKLADAGYSVTVFDQVAQAGGVPNASIPEFRLTESIIDVDIKSAKNRGIEFQLSRRVDEPSELLKEFASVFVGAGLHKNRKLSIPGEELPQVIDALTFLEQARVGKLAALDGKQVIVIGGGNVSLDVAATAASLKAAEVHLLYRRGPKEIKVWQTELEEAQHRGVIIDYLIAPVEFIADQGKLKAVKCTRMRLGQKLDSSGRRVSTPLEHSEFILSADLVVAAVGLSSDYLKGITVNADLSTSLPSVFAGGDWAKGEGTIVEAVRDGKAAANSIIAYLKGKAI
jgi:NADPH-dependent glutamate synthase beta subunit-like oxidoreductase